VRKVPYIKQERRDQLDTAIDNLTTILGLTGEPLEDGDVNYVITRIMDACYNRLSYAIMARGIATLECAKLEFYRRIMAPYEDEKRKKNGEVYDV
jgi:hypothetical protein